MSCSLLHVLLLLAAIVCSSLLPLSSCQQQSAADVIPQPVRDNPKGEDALQATAAGGNAVDVTSLPPDVTAESSIGLDSVVQDAVIADAKRTKVAKQQDPVAAPQKPTKQRSDPAAQSKPHSTQQQATQPEQPPIKQSASASTSASQPTQSPAPPSEPELPPHITKAIKKANARNTRLQKQRQSREGRFEKRLQAQQQRLDLQQKRREQEQDPAVKKLAVQKLQQMYDLTEASDNLVIDLTAQQYRQLVYQNPRPYWTLVVHQALSPQYQCPICHPYHQATEQIAQLVQQSQAARNMTSETLQSVAAQLTTLPRTDLPLFVVEAEIGKIGEIFQELGMSQAPITFLVPPTLYKSQSQRLKEFYNKMPSKYKYQLTSANSGANEVREFIAKHIPAYGQAPSELLATKPPVSELLMKLLDGMTGFLSTLVDGVSPLYRMLLSPALAGMAAFGTVIVMPIVIAVYFTRLIFYSPASLPPAERTYNYIVQQYIQRNTTVFALISILLYGLGTTGYMHNRIRGNLQHGTNQQGKPEYFAGGMMEQYVDESRIVMGVELSLAMTVLLLVLRASTRRSIDSSDKLEGDTSKRADSLTVYQQVDYVLSWLISPFLLLLLATFLFRNLVAIFNLKNWSYNYGWLWYFKSWEEAYRPVQKLIAPYTKYAMPVLTPILPYYNRMWRLVQRTLPSWVFAFMQ